VNSQEYQLLVNKIKEAAHAMELATQEIVILREMLEQAQHENDRLRSRLAGYARLIQRMEEGNI